LRKALALAPGDKRILTRLAIALWRNRDYDEALPLLTGLRGSSAEVDFAIGDTLVALGQPTEAVEPLTAALRRSPQLLEAEAALGKAYLRLGYAEKAAVHLSRAAVSDTDGSIHYQLARALERAGKSEDASQAMKVFEKLSLRDREVEQLSRAEITSP
jgi:predicted Zn-dependent protease